MISADQIKTALVKELTLVHDQGVRSIALDMGISYDIVANCATRDEVLDQIVALEQHCAFK